MSVKVICRVQVHIDSWHGLGGKLVWEVRVIRILRKFLRGPADRLLKRDRPIRDETGGKNHQEKEQHYDNHMQHLLLLLRGPGRLTV